VSRDASQTASDRTADTAKSLDGDAAVANAPAASFECGACRGDARHRGVVTGTVGSPVAPPDRQVQRAHHPADIRCCNPEIGVRYVGACPEQRLDGTAKGKEGPAAFFFGRVGEKWTKTYTLTVDFPNASGLIKGATVNLAGAPVGRVATAPKPLEDGSGVQVQLKVSTEAKIRADARFRIADVGLMGDRNVTIDPAPRSTERFLEDGDSVQGNTSSDFSNLTAAAQPILAQIQQITDRFNREVLTPETADDLRASIKDLRSVLHRTDVILAEAQSGKGTIGSLLKDPKTANDLRAFIANLRQKGILFYSDVSGKDDDGQRAKNR